MWDSQSHKGRPIFGGWHKSSPMVVVALGLLGFTTFVKFKMEEAWNSIVRWGPLGMVWPSLAEAAGHGIPSRTSWHPFGPARIFVHCRPKQMRNETSERILQQGPSEFSTNKNTSWTTKWGFPKIGVPLFYHPFDRFSMK